LEKDGAMPTENVRLAIEIAEAADRSVETENSDPAAEAHRLVAEHPQALVGEDEIAEVLQEEAERQPPTAESAEQKA
jgi:hypothetical protein